MNRILITAIVILLFANASNSQEAEDLTSRLVEGNAALKSGDPEKALLIWKELDKEYNEAGAQVNIGNLYRAGHGVEQDYSEAIFWYNKALKQGHPKAYYAMGVMYDNGWGVKKDHEKAAKLWDYSAQRGHVQSLYNLGILFYYGKGVPEDREKAYLAIKAAAEKGYQPALDALKQSNAN